MNRETAEKVILPCQAIWTAGDGLYSYVVWLQGYRQGVGNFVGEIVKVLEQPDSDNRQRGYYSDGWNRSCIKEIL